MMAEVKKRLWAMANRVGTISVMERTDTGLTCIKWVKDDDELEAVAKIIQAAESRLDSGPDEPFFDDPDYAEVKTD